MTSEARAQEITDESKKAKRPYRKQGGETAILRLLAYQIVIARQPQLRLAQAGPKVQELVDFAMTGRYGE